ncbi:MULTISPECIES: NAD(P)H-binding protein [unclassified Vibrio]|uniref:NAD(P)H-binding protein n=1 Tax=unclassified Vibrio TaxID=2614977 RepID=UPI001481E5DE|nr:MULTISPECIES: NAD(P)H-binding protein [unclassified Vibrio]MDQ2189599.1 NAD-dependent epimerase/dehydratase family protein [Vibrio sp. A14(2019)]MDQ2195197.1 NAD-dependent epimerase/dehydratase family protein [Vibrio sp. 2017_1457_11]NNN74282.1 NAD-dependent epimerase/dehydratase family protein [Vibrio sp. B7]NNN91289.1 NAD-dependent epimerase/dehydratase family protein [Vibrio sp. B8-1]NNO06238.1 NAD-dependent epimerase/dehydratase family protein [Vibrio sp. B4-12]
MNTITLIGAGWLGLPLAQALTENHQVYASRTQTAGMLELTQHGITGFVCDLSLRDQSLSQHFIAQKSEIVIGSFPPGFRNGRGQEYAQQWQHLVAQAKLANVRKIVMVSSTSVYPDIAQPMSEQHASLSLAQNDSHFSEGARIMLQAEQHVIDSGLDYVIVRCSGLIGPKRHPSRFAARLAQVSKLAPANMLHQKDAIGALIFASEKLSKQVVNATTPQTVSKAEFYQAALAAAELDSPLPPIVDIADKRILSDKLSQLGYQFHYSHTLEALALNE